MRFRSKLKSILSSVLALTLLLSAVPITTTYAAQIIKQEMPTSDKAALNPDWVEWLMGFPLKWTDANYGNESLSAFRV